MYSKLITGIQQALASGILMAYRQGACRNIAIIGGGGCSLPSHLLHKLGKNISIDVIEPSARVLRVAKQHFGFTDVSEGLDVTEFLMTGEQYLSDLCSNEESGVLDVVCCDAMQTIHLEIDADDDGTGYSEAKETVSLDLSPPPTLLGKIPQMFDLLSSGGYLFLNVVGPAYYIQEAYARVVAASSGFESTLLYKVKQGLATNYLVVARKGSGIDMEKENKELQGIFNEYAVESIERVELE